MLPGGDGWGVVVATSCSVHTQQLMVSGKENLAVTVALSVVVCVCSIHWLHCPSVEFVPQMRASLPAYKALQRSVS